MTGKAASTVARVHALDPSLQTTVSAAAKQSTPSPYDTTTRAKCTSVTPPRQDDAAPGCVQHHTGRRCEEVTAPCGGSCRELVEERAPCECPVLYASYRCASSATAAQAPVTCNMLGRAHHSPAHRQQGGSSLLQEEDTQCRASGSLLNSSC
jgi:hypothetical protein